MKTKEYPSLGMTIATRDVDERRGIIMKQIGELPLGQHLFDEQEMCAMADKIGGFVEATMERLLDAALEIEQEVNLAAAFAFIYLACQAARDHVNHYAMSAGRGLAITGADLLTERLGEDRFSQLMEADSKKSLAEMDPALAAILAALFRR